MSDHENDDKTDYFVMEGASALGPVDMTYVENSAEYYILDMRLRGLSLGTQLSIAGSMVLSVIHTLLHTPNDDPDSILKVVGFIPNAIRFLAEQHGRCIRRVTEQMKRESKTPKSQVN